MIVLVTKDLFFVPVFRSAAEQLDQQLLVVSDSGDEKLKHLEAEKVVAAVVDLSALPLDQLGATAEQLAEILPHATRVAFGSHVHASRMENAVLAGFHPVLTRGQINNRLPQLIEEWMGAGE